MGKCSQAPLPISAVTSGFGGTSEAPPPWRAQAGGEAWPPILIGGGPCTTISAWLGMAVREAARRFAVGNVEPGPAEPLAVVGSFSGVHAAMGRPVGCGGGGGAASSTASSGSAMMRRAGTDRCAAMVEGDRLRHLLSSAAVKDGVGTRAPALHPSPWG